MKINRRDFVRISFGMTIMPLNAKDYYGPNQALRNALTRWENTWQMILRETAGNDRHVSIKTGTLELLYPDIRIHAKGNRAEFKLTGGLGYAPVTFVGLASPDGFILRYDGKPVAQSVHGNDFWQTDYDPASRTYNLQIDDEEQHHVVLSRMS